MEYLYFDGVKIPKPDEYEVGVSDILADGSGETEAGTQQRDFKRRNIPDIHVSFTVTKKWILKLRGYRDKDHIMVRFYHGDMENAEMYINGYKESLEHETSSGGVWKVSFTLESY